MKKVLIFTIILILMIVFIGVASASCSKPLSTEDYPILKEGRATKGYEDCLRAYPNLGQSTDYAGRATCIQGLIN